MTILSRFLVRLGNARGNRIRLPGRPADGPEELELRDVVIADCAEELATCQRPGLVCLEHFDRQSLRFANPLQVQFCEAVADTTASWRWGISRARLASWIWASVTWRAT